MNRVRPIPDPPVRNAESPTAPAICRHLEAPRRVAKKSQGNRRIKIVQLPRAHREETTKPHTPFAADARNSPASAAPAPPPSTQYRETPGRQIAAKHLPASRQRAAPRRRRRDLIPPMSRRGKSHPARRGCPPHVELEPVAAMLQTKLERRQSIFRNVLKSPRPAMPQKKRCHSSSQFQVFLGA
jgi:hypothetical protein